MREQGLDSLFPISELAVMGLFEVVPHALHIYRRLRQTVAAVKAQRPAALITIDSPSFSLRIAKRLAGEGFPLIHYVAPQVWAWKAGRAKEVAGYLDEMLTLLPFEPPYFERHGLHATFVGHPAVEGQLDDEDGKALRNRLGISPDAPVICALPGSRKGEVRRLAPVFGEALGLLAQTRRELVAIVPTVETVNELVEDVVSRWPVPSHVLTGRAAKYATFDAADVGMAASGTVAVELAIAQLPSIIAYRVNPFSALIARRLLKVGHVTIPNLLMDKKVQPELLQENCTAPKLAQAVARLLDDPQARQDQIAACRVVSEKLGLGGEPPSDRAAKQILATIDAGASVTS